MLTHERKQLIHSIAPLYRALYKEQVVYVPEGWSTPVQLYSSYLDHKHGYLSLRSVKDLTEEEAIHVAKIVEPFVGLSGWWTQDNGSRWAEQAIQGIAMPYAAMVIDHLRSIGIATDYYTATTGLITVEEFIEAGTLVINPNQPV